MSQPRVGIIEVASARTYANSGSQVLECQMHIRLIQVCFATLLLLCPEDTFAKRGCCRRCQPMTRCVPVSPPIARLERQPTQFRDPNGRIHSVLKSNDVDVEELKEERELRSLTPELFALRER